MRKQYKTLTVYYPTRQKELKTSIKISSVVGDTLQGNYTGLWDTGATNCVITSKVVKDLKLQPTGVTTVSTAGGRVNSNVYDIKITLPNKIQKRVTVTEGDLGDLDALIGMDIIADGDFAISSNPNTGEMYFTHRSPSQGVIDFTDDVRKKQLPSQHKNNSKKNKQERQNKKRGRW